MLPMTVISEIPEVVTPSDQHENKRKLALGWVANSIVAVASFGRFCLSAFEQG